MEVVAYKLTPLAKRDLEFMQIQSLIEAKKRLLIEKQKKLRFITNQNSFLEEVRNDYNKYYGYISKQKEDQIKALQLIKDYITNLTISGQLSKQNVNDAKQEQKKILSEIKSIQSGLDYIMNDTDNMKQILKTKNIH
jgi:pyruvate/oxaloacetate carboxyltransferase